MQRPERKTSIIPAWRSASERRFYDGHDRKVDGSTTIQASLLRPWIRYFTIINYLYLVEFDKQQIKEVRNKIQPENSEEITPKRVWIRHMYSASVAFS